MTDLDAQVVERLKVILRRDLKLGPQAPIADDMPFFGSDLDLDSLDMLLLVTSVEKEFGVKIPNEAVGRTVFESVTTLAKFVQEHGGKPRQITASPAPTMTETDPLARLPHRDPFRFVSRITKCKPGDEAEGVWSVSGSESFFTGHFPGNPLVPGVLIAEALAQLSGVAGAAPDVPDAGKLGHVDVRFEQAVAPPAEIVLRSKLTHSIPPLQHFEVSAHQGEQIIARGTIVLSRS
jgi:3-hydroxyacyl-[acyl-carrier-protein] dehydratase